MNFFEWLNILGDVSKNENKDSDNFGLSDEEKEAMKNGGYEPFNFEEEELEDDDYYDEDDE